MKTLIDGTLYDTERAELITSTYPNGTQDRSDFRFVREELYVTDGGEYFIAGEGGPKTAYSQPGATGGRTGGEEIRRVTRKEALEWCEKHDEVVAATEEFDDLIEAA